MRVDTAWLLGSLDPETGAAGFAARRPWERSLGHLDLRSAAGDRSRSLRRSLEAGGYLHLSDVQGGSGSCDQGRSGVGALRWCFVLNRSEMEYV